MVLIQLLIKCVNVNNYQKNTNTIKAGKDQEVETQTQESNLNELSPKTMGRYVGAASTSLKTAAQKKRFWKLCNTSSKKKSI